MTQTTTLKVGDKVIYHQYGKQPVVTEVTKVTPKGYARVALHPEWLFKPAGYGGKYSGTERVVVGELHPYDEVLLADFTEQARKAEEEKQAKRDEAQRRRAEFAAEHARELEEIKGLVDALGGLDKISTKQVLPDGQRLYTLTLPAKPELSERKGGYEVVIVRCKDVLDHNKDFSAMEPFVEFAYTNTNAATCSFPSRSSQKAKTDEEGLWEAARSCYNSW